MLSHTLRASPLVVCTLSSGSFEPASTRQECSRLNTLCISQKFCSHSATFSLSHKVMSRSCRSPACEVVGMPSARTKVAGDILVVVLQHHVPLHHFESQTDERNRSFTGPKFSCLSVALSVRAHGLRWAISLLHWAQRPCVSTASSVDTATTKMSHVACSQCIPRVQTLFHLSSLLLGWHDHHVHVHLVFTVDTVSVNNLSSMCAGAWCNDSVVEMGGREGFEKFDFSTFVTPLSGWRAFLSTKFSGNANECLLF